MKYKLLIAVMLAITNAGLKSQDLKIQKTDGSLITVPLETIDSITFYFVEPFVCGISTVTDFDDNVYNTVQIGDQCWMKENLRVGTMIIGFQGMTDNGIIEKWCQYNLDSNCIIYGGLYNWDEMMAYSTTQGAQGICPDGWKIPTDEDWKMLEGAVDSQYNYPDPEWENTSFRGFDSGKNLKATSGWYPGGNGTDLYGFGALPGGMRDLDANFDDVLIGGYWWSSSETSATHAYHRYLSYLIDGSYRNSLYKVYGRSVRCLMDN